MSVKNHTLSAFIHLRVHSAYSLLEGALPVKLLAELADENAMPALAITDTGNLFGALEFSEILSKKGIQPIIGCCLKIDLQESDDGPAPRGIVNLPHIVLLAKDAVGYANLMKLSSRAYVETDETALPHISWQLLQQSADGLICLTGATGGPVNMALNNGQLVQAHQRLRNLRSLFGDRLYVELQRHGMVEETTVEPQLIEMAYELELPLVATNEAFFAKTEDFAAHDALICIAEGEVVATQERRRLTPEHYFKSGREMVTLFADLPEAIENTIEIARRCAFRPLPHDPILPHFSSVDGATMDEAEELRRQAKTGLASRLENQGLAPDTTRETYEKRLDFELDVIIGMKFPGYFLIVADFIKYAKDHDIPVGPGRGSGAGSLVAYSLLITDLDPLQFNLLFERFLNPERVSMPDFDIDFCQDRRDEVIDYVQARYGKDQVAQIITFGKLQARNVCRDVGRVLQMPYGQVDRLCKMIPNNPANPVTLQQAISGEPRIQEEASRDETVSTMLQFGVKLEGLFRHASTHAAGVVIGDRALEQLVPLYRDPRSTMPATQFNMKWVEPAGLVKFDFLGLKTLTVIDNAVKMVHARGIELDIAKIPYDDSGVYDMLGKGDTVGVFQLESSGMRDVLRKMRPDCIEDVIAIVALYRPGPMDNIPSFIKRKLGEEDIDYLHPWLEALLKETYGVIVYQEQVMQIAQIMAGYSLGEADLLRRAMGKKIKSEMDLQKERFVSGALAKGVDGEKADFIFELVAKFAGYGFNKSHAACYGVVAYQTAYMKANYPVEFLAASMTLDMNNTDKLQVFRREAQRIGITVASPDVNHSPVKFGVEDGGVRYALAALKNVGEGAVQQLVENRAAEGPFTSLSDFARRLDGKALNKRSMESLAKAGAFDSLNPNRAQVLAGVEAILAMANRTSAEQEQGQSDMFGSNDNSDADLPLPNVEQWLAMDKLSREFEAIGFYLSGHPLDEYMTTLARIGVTTWADFHHRALNQGASAAKLAGTVTMRQERRSKSGNPFAFIGFSDASGQFEAICFADTLAHYRDLLEPGMAVIIRVEADVENEEVRLRLHGVESLEKSTQNVAQGIVVFVQDEQPLESISKRLTNGGRAPVHLIIQPPGSTREIKIALGNKFTVNPQIKGAIKAIPGVVDVQDL